MLANLAFQHGIHCFAHFRQLNVHQAAFVALLGKFGLNRQLCQHRQSVLLCDIRRAPFAEGIQALAAVRACLLYTSDAADD